MYFVFLFFNIISKIYIQYGNQKQNLNTMTLKPKNEK